MKKSIAPLLFGITFILAGIGYLGSAVLGWDFDLFFDGWWTLFIIIPSFVSILANGPRGFNITAFLIGVILLLSRQIPHIFNYRHTGIAIVAVVIISIGVSLIAGFFRKPNNPTYFNYQPNSNYQAPPQADDAQSQHQPYTEQPKSKTWSYDATNFPNYNAILSGVDTKNTSTNFEGARVSAILGSVDLDLRNAIVTHDITVYVTAILGGVDIFAPQNVKIAINKTDILGGTDCRAYTMPQESSAPVVTFVCTTVMGGIDIK